MSWKKYFTPVKLDNQMGSSSPISGGGRPGPARANYSSYLPDVYAGTPNRIERYMQYDTMDMDSEVNAALDILAEFCTQKDKENATPFQTFYRGNPTSTEVKLIKESLQKWTKQQQFETRIFRPHGTTNTSPTGTSTSYSGGSQGRGMVGNVSQPPGTRFHNQTNEVTVDAKNVVHISLSEGLDANYPFGNSLLESVFKVYKQKELLEDAIIIYRVQRAPERRIFYIDVGNMPAHMAMSFVERVKNEIQQRRIPSSTGGGNNVIDASYNPLSASEDYFFPQTAEGRGSKVDTLAGGTNLGEITDLRFFTNKLFRALRIPAAYLPTGIEEASNTVADGKVGTAYIQELRFNKYCERLQNSIVETFDLEFKLWMESNGVNIDPSLFELKFNPPQNFAAYRQSELDTARAATFAQLQEIPHLSKRFAMKRFLGMTQEEITENERMWREEQGGNLKPVLDAAGQMRSVGITPSGTQADLAGQEAEAPQEAPVDTGAEGEAAPAEAPAQ